MDGFLKFAIFKDLNDPEDISTFLTQSVEGQCEGLMVKTLEVRVYVENCIVSIESFSRVSDCWVQLNSLG